MAAKSGTITGSFAVTWLTPSLRWTVTNRTASGIYTLKVEAIVTVTGSGVTTNRKAYWTLVVNGTTLASSEQIQLKFDKSTPYPQGTSAVFLTKTTTINANTDGSAKSVSMSLTINTNGGASGNGTVSGTASLIPYFYWTGSYANDTTNIATGKPVSNITASKWNAFNQMITTWVSSSYTYTSVSSGSVMTATICKQPATPLGVSTTNIASGNAIPASYFISLRDALNTK